MADRAEEILKNVPLETRWAITANAGQSVFMTYMSILRDIAGEERATEITDGIFRAGGPMFKMLVESLGLVGDDALAASHALKLGAFLLFGPEPVIEVKEETKDRVVSTQTVCPIWNRRKELGHEWLPYCIPGHTAWAEGVLNAINPNLSFSITKAVEKGDPCCEWVVELKK